MIEKTETVASATVTSTGSVEYTVLSVFTEDSVEVGRAYNTKYLEPGADIPAEVSALVASVIS